MEVELGGQGLREHPVWGIEGHLCTLPTLQFYRRVAPGLLGVGGTGSGSPPTACLRTVVCSPRVCDVTVGCQAVYQGG